MNKLLIFLFIFLFLDSIGQDHIIKFRGSGASVQVEKVIVENLTQKIKINVYTNQVLRLSGSPEFKSAAASNEVVMAYNKNERIRFTGISGEFETIIVDSPTRSKTFTFSFIGCLDGEKKNYPVVQIGNQMWMAKNVASRKLTDGTRIPISFVPSDYYDPEYKPSLYAYGNSSYNFSTYGGLYDWDLVWTGKLCPEGWHVPSVSEWETLIDYLGGKNKAGTVLKESGNGHWLILNEETTDSLGFRALPGGINTNDAVQYKNIGYVGYFWTADVNPQNLTNAYYVAILDNNTPIQIDSYIKNTSSSLRCVYDNEVPQFQEIKDTILCEGETYNNWDLEGQYHEKFTSVMGYDSVVSTNLSFYDSPDLEIIVSGDTVKSQNHFESYSWININSGNQVSEQAEFVINESGQYYLNVMDEFGCEKTSEVLNLYHSSTKNKKALEFDYSIIPNPNNGEFEIRFNSFLDENISFKLLNSQGVVVKKEVINDAAQNNSMYFRVNNFKKGIYFLVIIRGKERITEKILIN